MFVVFILVVMFIGFGILKVSKMEDLKDRTQDDKEEAEWLIEWYKKKGE